jgi:hypothetical protein
MSDVSTPLPAKCRRGFLRLGQGHCGTPFDFDTSDHRHQVSRMASRGHDIDTLVALAFTIDEISFLNEQSAFREAVSTATDDDFERVCRVASVLLLKHEFIPNRARVLRFHDRRDESEAVTTIGSTYVGAEVFAGDFGSPSRRQKSWLPLF